MIVGLFIPNSLPILASWYLEKADAVAARSDLSQRSVLCLACAGQGPRARGEMPDTERTI